MTRLSIVAVATVVMCLLDVGRSDSNSNGGTSSSSSSSVVELDWKATAMSSSSSSSATASSDNEAEALGIGPNETANSVNPVWTPSINSATASAQSRTSSSGRSGSIPNNRQWLIDSLTRASSTSAAQSTLGQATATSRASSAETTAAATAAAATAADSPLDDSCRIYLAPSTIPGAGLGTFAGRSFVRGDEVTTGDAVVPIADMAYHFGGDDHVDTFLWDEYIWSGDTFAGMGEPHHDIDGASFGIGAAPNCYFPLLNVKDTHTLRRDYGYMTDENRTSPGIGAFTPFYDRRSHATTSILKGMELFVDYGYSYFQGDRIETFGRIPFLNDFKKADTIIEKYNTMTQKLVRTAWKQCLMRTENATERKQLCQLNTIEEHDAFRAFKEDVYNVAKKVLGVWPTRTLAALPETPHTIKALLQTPGGTKMRDFERSHHNMTYLIEHGSCMDYLVAKPSTLIPIAGRGAFAARFLPKDSVVAPVPLIHLPDRSVLDMYPGAGTRAKGRNASDTPIHQQLLLNYCFGHAQSTLLLCPYGVVSSLVNHAPLAAASLASMSSSPPSSPISANVKIVWSSKISAHLEWRDQPVKEWGHLYQAGLGFDYVALRDIQEGEEILLDYGRDWQEAWDRHVQTWQPVERLVDVLNRDIDSIVPTEQEWKWRMGDPNAGDKQAVNLWCYNIYREMQGLKMSDADSYPCKVVLRLDDPNGIVPPIYTVELVYHKQLVDSDNEMCEEWFDEVLWMLPRDALAYGGVYERFDTREYATPGTFRQPLGIPDDIMPDVWKNVPPFNLTAVSVEQRPKAD